MCEDQGGKMYKLLVNYFIFLNIIMLLSYILILIGLAIINN